VPPLLPLKDGYLFLDKVKFPDACAGDVDLKTAVFMADSQVPWGVNALGGAVTEPAWKSKPSWYLQVRDDDDSFSRTTIHGETGRRHRR